MVKASERWIEHVADDKLDTAFAGIDEAADRAFARDINERARDVYGDDVSAAPCSLVR